MTTLSFGDDINRLADKVVDLDVSDKVTSQIDLLLVAVYEAILENVLQRRKKINRADMQQGVSDVLGGGQLADEAYDYVSDNWSRPTLFTQLSNNRLYTTAAKYLTLVLEWITGKLLQEMKLLSDGKATLSDLYQIITSQPDWEMVTVNVGYKIPDNLTVEEPEPDDLISVESRRIARPRLAGTRRMEASRTGARLSPLTRTMDTTASRRSSLVLTSDFSGAESPASSDSFTTREMELPSSAIRRPQRRSRSGQFSSAGRMPPSASRRPQRSAMRSETRSSSVRSRSRSPVGSRARSPSPARTISSTIIPGPSSSSRPPSNRPTSSRSSRSSMGKSGLEMESGMNMTRRMRRPRVSFADLGSPIEVPSRQNVGSVQLEGSTIFIGDSFAIMDYFLEKLEARGLVLDDEQVESLNEAIVDDFPDTMGWVRSNDDPEPLFLAISLPAEGQLFNVSTTDLVQRQDGEDQAIAIQSITLET